MGDTTSLSAHDAVTKLKEIIDHNSICMMVTNGGRSVEDSRPMSVAEVCDQGHLWFLTLRTSHKHDQLAHDPAVQLYFATPGHQEYLTVHGTTRFSNDERRKKELWSAWAKAWVPEGPEDPDLEVLEVIPTDAYCWDTKDGRVVAMAKILSALITGNRDDGGVEGRLDV